MASGNYLAIFTPLHYEPPTSNFAALFQRNQDPCLAFDDTTDQNAVFSHVLPPSYSGGGLTVDLHWAAASAVTGDTRWQVSIERIGTTQDIDTDGFATAQTAGTTTSGTSGIPVITSIPFTSGAQMDSLVAGEAYRLKVSRDADGTTGTDSMVGDAHLLRAVVKET